MWQACAAGQDLAAGCPLVLIAACWMRLLRMGSSHIGGLMPTRTPQKTLSQATKFLFKSLRNVASSRHGFTRANPGEQFKQRARELPLRRVFTAYQHRHRSEDSRLLVVRASYSPRRAARALCQLL